MQELKELGVMLAATSFVYAAIFYAIVRTFRPSRRPCEHRFLRPPTKVVRSDGGRTLRLVTTSEAWRCASCGEKVEPPKAGFLSNEPSDRRRRR